ncbi:PIN domain-containing protein [Streptomyces microflavus]|uniref:PIN domain-containing protein n=1 Tax=Streptomyces microflavus TaxID=1919 RepID=UPI0029A62153|nr:PIN domain-containing protein [Streptomyces microflavus]MDX2407030.1 PIN domain-containing protein [Streptomyces microflavus]
MKDICFILDSEALSRVALRDRALTGLLTKAHQAGSRVLTSPMTLVEAYHSRVRLAEWNWAMSRLVVEPVTKEIADEAIRLLLDTGLHGHKYAIDAVLAVLANRQRGRAVVLTSDADDLTKLCAPRVQVRAL